MATVLIVEDELAIAELLADVLSDEGHRVMVAGNGMQALRIASQDPPAVILSDFMMPVLDGPGFLQAMAVDPALRTVPVIMMSSLPESTVAQRCTGYRYFLRKPFRIFEVVDLISRLTTA